MSAPPTPPVSGSRAPVTGPTGTRPTGTRPTGTRPPDTGPPGTRPPGPRQGASARTGTAFPTSGGVRPAPEPGASALKLLAAVLTPVALSYNAPVISLLTTGLLVVLVVAPLWLPDFVRTAPGVVLLVTGAAFVCSGFLLGWVSRADHEIVTSFAVTAAVTITTNLAGIGALSWASRVIGVQWVVFLYGAVWLLQSARNPADWALNPWKFGFVFPVALVVLSVVDRQRSTGIKVIALATLGLVSVLNDSRSVFAMFLITALVLVWQRFRSHSAHEPSIAAFLGVAILVGGILYYALTRLLVSGVLGAGLKARSEAQVESSGSLLLGGRPEWTVTIRLFRDRPWGFGFGTTPSPADFELGRQGFASINLISQENYLKNYVFDAVFRLHSITADLWAAGGIVGILLVLLMIKILVTSLARELAYRTASAAHVFLTLLALWDIGFSPIYSNLHEVMLALGVALAAGWRRGDRAGPRAPARSGDVVTRGAR